jgi:hypothetical protein
MARVWAVAPSIRPNGGTLPKWKESGYNVAVLRQGEPFPEATVTLGTDHYLGWAKSINTLVKWVMGFDNEAEFFVVSNDDTLPDPNHTPEQIADECNGHFRGTFGVCQPTGDRWGDTPSSRAQFGESRGAGIDRFAGSPFMGREWCERAYSGRGPLFDGYLHCFSDEELLEVATALGVYWPRIDLMHLHQHWGRGAEPKPEWWDRIAGADYRDSRALFEERKRNGFPGHEPLPIAVGAV